jgi:hypothetical protein
MGSMMGRLFDGGRSLGAIQQALANQAQELISLFFFPPPLPSPLSLAAS